MYEPAADAWILALDTASPVISLALGRGDTVILRTAAGRRATEELLPLLDEACTEAGIRPRELGGVLAVRGPGSFTGLRIGLALALGLHQALEIPAGARTSHEVLAAAAGDGVRNLITLVPAGSGRWSALDRSAPEEGPASLTAEQLLTRSGARLFGSELAALATAAPPDITVEEAPPLAPVLLDRGRWAPCWDPSDLGAAVYARAPAADPAARRPLPPAP